MWGYEFRIIIEKTIYLPFVFFIFDNNKFITTKDGENVTKIKLELQINIFLVVLLLYHTTNT